jgi:hypothetical protein
MACRLWRRAGLLLLAVICGLPAAGGTAAAATVVANGNLPDAVVDRDGVTHLVWNEAQSGGNPDVLHYCQIPVGGTACVNAESFVPPSDQPSINGDLYGPHVMVTPFGEVILLTSRCCANQIVGRYAPNVIYISDDGGETFGPPAAVSNNPPGNGAPVLFDGADRRIVTVAVHSEGFFFQAAPLGQWTETHAVLSGLDANQSVSAVQRARNSFAVAWQDSHLNTSVRTFTCSLDPCPLAQANDAASWTPAVSIENAILPRMTSGPAGTFLMYRSVATATDNQYFVRKLDGATLGPALPVATGRNDRRDIVEDATGILHALFTDDHLGLSYRASGDGGVTWGAQQTIVAGEDSTIQSVRVAARSTDGGFVGRAFWESDNGSTLNPPILMADLPPPSVSLPVPPTPPGGGGTPTPPAPPAPPVPPAACRLLSFAAVDVIADACMKKEGDTYVATGGVKINGLRIELGSGTLRLDTKRRTISSSGATVTVKLGPTVLFKSSVNWTLPKASVASLGLVNVSSGGGVLLGFPLRGSAEIKFRGGGVEVPVHLGLPALFGGVTGDVTVRADNVAGVHLRELHVRVGDALIGPLEIKDVLFDYDADKQSWAGGATLILPPQPPGPSLAGKIAFTDGKLDYLRNELTLPSPGIVLDPFGATYLRKIRFEVQTNPLQLKGGVTITAGPTIAGLAAVSVDGDLTFTLGDPAILRADGRVSIVSIPLGSAFFELRTNGYVGFGGHVGYEFAGFKATSDVSGWLFKSAFSASAVAKVCLGDLGCADGEVVFSSVGFAGCAKTPFVDFGAGFKWSYSLKVMFAGCDIGPYKASAAATQVAGARTVTFGSRVPSGVVAVQGAAAPPHVALVAPGGARVADTPGTKTATATSISFHNPQTNTTYFVLKTPAAGTWTVEPAPDSVAITGVQYADGLKDPKVTGSVKRAGRARVLSYKVTPIPGQKVSFAEQGKSAAHPIGRTVAGGRGKVRFTPTEGPGGKRKIIALVSSYGEPRAQITVATYIASAPAKPAHVKRLRARRSGTRLSVTWAKAANAKRYELRATLSDGRRIFVRQRGTRFTITAVATKTRATIFVVGLTADGKRGKQASVVVLGKKAKIKSF